MIEVIKHFYGRLIIRIDNFHEDDLYIIIKQRRIDIKIHWKEQKNAFCDIFSNLKAFFLALWNF